MSLKDEKNRMMDELEKVQAFTSQAQDNQCDREEILNEIEVINELLKSVDQMSADFETAMKTRKEYSHGTIAKKLVEFKDKYGNDEEVESFSYFLEVQKDCLSVCYDTLRRLSQGNKNFDKNLCFSNIRWLLKQKPEVKIGQIEKEAGIRLGYMSRLEKEGNTSEPSIEFVVTAAKLLNVGIDTLVSINLSGLTANEKYLLRVFDKLKTDTLADKLEWNIEKATYLNYMETDINGNTGHPLFELRTFYEKTEIEYPNQVTRVIFPSKSFEENTYINGDCYNLRLKNGTILYLMNICKNTTSKDDPPASAIEAWTYVPKSCASVLLTSLDQSSIAPIVSALYEVVKNQMTHLRINKSAIPALDAFLKNDLEDDPSDFKDSDIPF